MRRDSGLLLGRVDGHWSEFPDEHQISGDLVHKVDWKVDGMGVRSTSRMASYTKIDMWRAVDRRLR